MLTCQRSGKGYPFFVLQPNGLSTKQTKSSLADFVKKNTTPFMGCGDFLEIGKSFGFSIRRKGVPSQLEKRISKHRWGGDGRGRINTHAQKKRPSLLRIVSV